MELFPAVLIGGPPHSGKSVLAYSLTQALRQQGVDHYLLRACPDGEGDWSNQLEPAQVRTIRVKGDWTPEWVDYICRDIARRHLPLLVDVGGRPEPWQEPIFNHCTHAILLAPTEAALTEWQGYAQRYGLTILAELISSLTEEPVIWQKRPLFKARLTGLERGSAQHGPVFEALVDKIAPYLDYEAGEIRQLHLNMAPVEAVVDLDRLARALQVRFTGEKATWQPRHLPAVLDYLPAGEPLGLYGRGPNWLYAAVALHAQPAPFVQFDVRLGWVTPPALTPGLPTPSAPLQADLRPAPQNGVEFIFTLPDSYLDYNEAAGLIIPIPPHNRPLILNGQLPLWLLTALVIAYQPAPLLAVYQPPVGRVVIKSNLAAYRPGDLLGA